MGEIEGDAHVCRIHVAHHQQRGCHIRQQAEGARLVGLVFDGSVDLRIVGGNDAERLRRMVPGSYNFV